MFIGASGSDCCGLKSIEDQVSADIRDVVQASKSDLMARGVAIDLLQMAKRVGPQYEAAEYEDLSGEEGFSLDSVTIDDRRGHCSDQTSNSLISVHKCHPWIGNADTHST